MRGSLWVNIYFVLIGLLVVSFLLPGKVVVEPSKIDLPADGISRTAVHLQVKLPWVRRLFFPHPRISVELIQGEDFVRIYPRQEARLSDRGATFFVQPRAAEGETIVRFRVHNATPAELRVFTHTVSTDSNNDGFPDAFHLTSFSDRENFRESLGEIVESQVNEISPLWPADQQSDAGLICFAMREALRAHTDQWRNRLGLASRLASVEKYNFPLTPLGEKVLRTRAGAYKPTDLSDGTFSECVNAGQLREFNSNFVSRDDDLIQPGDLMFFRRRRNNEPQVMVVLKNHLADSSAKSFWAAYFVGPEGDRAGRVKKIQLTLLAQDSDRDLRPVKSNQNFLGFYRLRIVK